MGYSMNSPTLPSIVRSRRSAPYWMTVAIADLCSSEGTSTPGRGGQQGTTSPRDGNVLARFEALGLVDCLVAMRPAGRLEGCLCTHGDDCTHTRTRLDPRRPHVA